MSRAACWGMNRSSEAASSTRRPRIVAATRLALRVDPRRYLAVAVTRTGPQLPLQRRLPAGVLAGPTVGAGVGVLTEPEAVHDLGPHDPAQRPSVLSSGPGA